MLFFIAACNHPIEIVGQGDVLSASGKRNCLLEEFQAGMENYLGSPGAFDPRASAAGMPQSSLQGGIHGVPRIEHAGVHPLK